MMYCIINILLCLIWQTFHLRTANICWEEQELVIPTEQTLNVCRGGEFKTSPRGQAPGDKPYTEDFRVRQRNEAQFVRLYFAYD